MPNRIEIALKDGVRDARGERIKREIEHFLHLAVAEVRTIDVYTVDAALSQSELEQVASGPFSDPVIQVWSIDLFALSLWERDWVRARRPDSTLRWRSVSAPV